MELDDYNRKQNMTLATKLVYGSKRKEKRGTTNLDDYHRYGRIALRSLFFQQKYPAGSLIMLDLKKELQFNLDYN